MLSLSPVFSLALALLGPQSQAAAENPGWGTVAPSVAFLLAGGTPVGVAALLDDKGHFLAFQPNLGDGPIVGRLATGETVMLSLVATDPQTQLVLLLAPAWSPGQRPPVQVAPRAVVGDRLLAVTPGGPAFGQFAGDERLGIVRPSLRYALFSEVRIEATGPLGGAMVFDRQGRLVAVLGATLTPETPGEGHERLAQTQRLGNAAPVAVPKRSVPDYGPQGMTVAYSFSPKVLARVVDGFLSPTRSVQHPTVGFLFRAADRPGALVEVVRPGLPAAVAGVLTGDLVVKANGKDVRSPRDLAQVLLALDVGDKLSLIVVRDGEERTLEVTVGAQSLLD